MDHETLIETIINHEDQFLINQILNNKFRKKNRWKKKQKTPKLKKKTITINNILKGDDH